MCTEENEVDFKLQFLKKCARSLTENIFPALPITVKQEDVSPNEVYNLIFGAFSFCIT